MKQKETCQNKRAPKILSNQPSGKAEDDFIGFHAYLQAIETAVENENHMIGVLSEFGTGKSTLMEQIQEKYDKEQNVGQFKKWMKKIASCFCDKAASGTKLIRINLWRNIKEGQEQKNEKNLLAMHKSFLYQFASQMGEKWGIPVMRYLNPGYGFVKFSVTKISTWGLLILSGACFVISKLLSWELFVWGEKTPAGLISALLVLSVLSFILAVFRGEVFVTSPKVRSAQEATEEDLSEVYLSIVKQAKRQYKKIIIVFEDIDRTDCPLAVKTFLTGINKYYIEGRKNGVAFIVNMKPEALLNSQTEKPEKLFPKIFDCILNLQAVNSIDLKLLMEEYILYNKEFYSAYGLEVAESGNVEKMKGMATLCYGKDLDIRNLKLRLNHANQLFYSLNLKFDYLGEISKPATQFERCAIVAYLVDAFAEDFYKLEQNTIGEIISCYIGAGAEHAGDWEYAIESVLQDSVSSEFKAALEPYLRTKRIDRNYRLYFYNYPKLAVIRPYEADFVYDGICYQEPMSEEFARNILACLEQPEKIILEAYENIESRGVLLPESVFQNDELLKVAMADKPRMVEEYLQTKLLFSKRREALKSLAEIEKSCLRERFHENYAPLLSKILRVQLSEKEDSDILEFRMEFMASVLEEILKYTFLFSPPYPSITIEEMKMVREAKTALALIQPKRVTPQVLKQLSQMVVSESFTPIVCKRMEDVFEETIYSEESANRGFVEEVEGPILIAHMKWSSRIVSTYEFTYLQYVKACKEGDYKEYLQLIHQVALKEIPDSTFKQIREEQLYEGLNAGICNELKERGMGLEYFMNLRDGAATFPFDEVTRTLFCDAAEELYQQDASLYLQYRERFTQLYKKEILNFNILFSSPLPIIRAEEIKQIESLSAVISLLENSLLTLENMSVVADFFCSRKRSYSATHLILNFVCKLQTDVLRSALFHKLNFEQLTYTPIARAKKEFYLRKLTISLELEDPIEAIGYMKKTGFLDETLEKTVLENKADTVYEKTVLDEEYAKLLFFCEKASTLTIDLILKDEKIRKRPNYILELLYTKKQNAIYVASLRCSRDTFIFERDKLEELDAVYWGIYCGKLNYQATRAAMFLCEEAVAYAYHKNKFDEMDLVALLTFTGLVQTPELINAVLDRAVSEVGTYLNQLLKKGDGLKFSNSNCKELLLKRCMEEEEQIKDTEIHKALRELYPSKEERKKIGVALRKANRKQ